jgi:hypothetical protein
MSDGYSNGYKKDVSIIDRWRELSGLYKLGIDPDSVIGFVFPFIVVAVIGGGLGAIIRYWL